MNFKFYNVLECLSILFMIRDNFFLVVIDIFFIFISLLIIMLFNIMEIDIKIGGKDVRNLI